MKGWNGPILPPYDSPLDKKVEPIKDLNPKNPGIYTENPGLRYYMYYGDPTLKSLKMGLEL